jgi:hypothetical protein
VKQRKLRKSKRNKKKMGAKASTAGNQSPRTFSNSSSSDVVSAGNNPTSFNFLRAINVNVEGDSRQRARSMSSVPDIHSSATTSSSTHNHHHHHHNHHYPQNAYSNNNNNSQTYEVVNGFVPNINIGAGAHFDLTSNAEENNSHDDNNQMHSLGIGRVVAATSLPSHIWSLNGEFTHILMHIIPIHFSRSVCVQKN